MNARNNSQSQNARGMATPPRLATRVTSNGTAKIAWTNPESPRNHHTNRPPNIRYRAHPAGSRGPSGGPTGSGARRSRIGRWRSCTLNPPSEGVRQPKHRSRLHQSVRDQVSEPGPLLSPVQLPGQTGPPSRFLPPSQRRVRECQAAVQARQVGGLLLQLRTSLQLVGDGLDDRGPPVREV